MIKGLKGSILFLYAINRLTQCQLDNEINFLLFYRKAMQKHNFNGTWPGRVMENFRSSL